MTVDLLSVHVEGDEALWLAAKAGKELIDAFTQRIHGIETWILKHLRPQVGFGYLLTLPGVGEILGMTILFETGPIQRFPRRGQLRLL